MTPSPVSIRTALLAALGAAALAATLSTSVGAAGVVTAEGEAAAACEQSARRTLATKVTEPADITFKSAPTAQPAQPGDTQLVLNGEGRWHSADGFRNVRFTCYIDRSTLETVGVVLRDATPVVAKPAPVRKPAEPDLSHLSMASCESSAVQALQKRWPRVSQITFDSDTRSFRQDSIDRAVLHGRGRALPNLGAPSTFFGFECEIDPHDGQVLRTRVSG